MCDSNSEKCPQDGKYYIGDVATNCCFASTKTVNQGGGKCDPNIFYTSSCAKKGSSVCPTGYTYTTPKNPCSEAQICAYESGGGLRVPVWKLNKGCLGDEPHMSSEREVACCIGQPPQGVYYKNCATGYCPNNSTCAKVMADYCLKNGLDPQCEKFFDVTNNTTSKRLVGQAMLGAWIQESPDPTKNGNFKDMAKLCGRLAPPGTCDQQLYKFCNILTRDELNKNVDYKNLCGCFLAQKEYNEFNKVLKGAGALPDICDPLCASSDTQRGDRNCNTDRCKSAICVIDLGNGQVQKAIQNNEAINQTCVTSKGGSSECYIAMTNMSRAEMRQMNIHVDQKCGQCFLYDPKKPYKEGVNPQPVDCKHLAGGGNGGNGGGGNGGGNNPPTSPSTNNEKKKKIIITISVVVALVIIIIILMALFL